MLARRDYRELYTNGGLKMGYIVEVLYMDKDDSRVFKCKNKDEVIGIILDLRTDCTIEHINYRRA
jgi:hypothetical protein